MQVDRRSYLFLVVVTVFAMLASAIGYARPDESPKVFGRLMKQVEMNYAKPAGKTVDSLAAENPFALAKFIGHALKEQKRFVPEDDDRDWLYQQLWWKADTYLNGIAEKSEGKVVDNVSVTAGELVKVMREARDGKHDLFVERLTKIKPNTMPGVFDPPLKQRPEYKYAIEQNKKRSVLIIGNSEYKNLDKATWAKFQAGQIAQALKELGFKVNVKQDLSRDEMRKAMQSLSQTHSYGNQPPILFYLGRGFRTGTAVYLQGTDFEAKQVGSYSELACPLSTMYPPMISFVIMNDEGPKFDRSLVEFGDSVADMYKENVFIVNTGVQHRIDDMESFLFGEYTSSLISNFKYPGQTLDQLMNIIREDIYPGSKNSILPWTFSTATKEMYIMPKKEE
jgi:Caspase domain